ncbi:MAG: hypothetical protein ACWGOX_15270 [Desulforhopalus sp.]
MDEEKKEQPVVTPESKPSKALKWDDKLVELVKLVLEFNYHKTGLKKEF